MMQLLYRRSTVLRRHWKPLLKKKSKLMLAESSGVNLHYGIKVNPLCIAPMGAKYPRKLPNGIWDKFMNFVQIDVLGG